MGGRQRWPGAAWEEQLSAQGEVCWTAAVEDTRSGELVGYSEMYWSPLRAAALHQGATAVRPSARGQGLGKWLKAALTRQVASACPGASWVRTGNANENAAMLGNAALGFAPWAETTEWQLKLSPLA
ncbi:GNAT family N-acetyltransferase [Deinococcus rubellus]|uniref:GNAT family N-acetyltransferase n=1 Tax=Deinococcus rubellus TaxID=1889240 RepID=A0ABY5YK33_9DEIO|nr:GNAT family N-acetyltransferase [Deinococcus rubellus]UWX65449.1 GNAT family N-acetyltransferase [Deinococcus rubellus]